MGDSPGILSFRFDHEDRVQRARTKIDTNQDHIVSDAELASNPSEKQNLDTLLPGVKPPLTSPTTPTAQEYLKSGSGVVSNRSLFSIPHQGAGITEMNIGDASNSQRLRAAGLTEAQLYNSQNIFVHLGQKDGKDQYGFYSKGFGEGDERAGVVAVGPDGKISSSLGAGWSAATDAEKQELEAAFTAREKLVKDKFGGDFQAYKNFETARAQVDDLLARGDIPEQDRSKLKDFRTSMDSNPTIPEGLKTILCSNESNLQQIRQAEAAGKVADGANTGTEADLNTALRTQTDKVNALTDAEKSEYSEALKKFNENLTSLGQSKHSHAESFRKAGEYLNEQDLPQNKQTLGELKWQNARFEKMMRDNAFKAAVDAARTPATPPATPTPTTPTTPPATTPTTPSSDNPAIPSTHKSAEEMATELGFADQVDNNSFLEQLSMPNTSYGGVNFAQSSAPDSPEVLVSKGDKHFLYDRDSRTARSLTPVTDSQDAFYDASEPSTLLLRNSSKSGFEKLTIDLTESSTDDYPPMGGSTYRYIDGKWQLISQ